jgi:T5SS/PEP-CTERM-associated repeat protein
MIQVDGPNSAWDAGELQLGSTAQSASEASTGILNITGGANVVIAGYAVLGTGPPESSGILTIAGPGSKFTVGIDLYVGGFGGDAIVSIQSGGTVDVLNNIELGYEDGGEGSGTIELSEGVLRLHGGSLTKGIGSNAPQLYFSGGRLEGAGLVDLGHPLVQNGGTLAPGNSAGTTTIEASYTLNAGSLEIEIDGPGGSGVGWDLVVVNGAVDLIGADATANALVNIELGMAPTIGQGFLILQNDGVDPILGTFANGPTVSATFGNRVYDFAVNYTAGDGNDIGVWTQSVSLLGDYNGDGMVDAADYTVWRNSYGQPVAVGQFADGDRSGIIDDADYVVWKRHFGESTVIGSGAHSGVPESSTAAIAMVACGLVAAGRRRR